MLAKRIIPCLDVLNGRVVKGVEFTNFRDAGDPVELARRYNDEGADELSFLDITASYEKRDIIIEVVRKVAKEVFIPLSVGGGINSLDDIRQVLTAGAEKVSIGTAAILQPELITKAADEFGCQCIVVSIDAKRNNSDSWNVFINGGREDSGTNVLEFVKKVEKLGAGEILLNSIDRDGTKSGFDITLTRRVTTAVNIPVIASGGAGKLESILEVFQYGKADAALVASLFHYNEYSINEVKSYLTKNGVEVRR